MKFAILNGARVEPEKGCAGAICPICKQPVVARCGDIRLPHWAHKSVIDCDPWKENETQWHRDWKDLFGDMQEKVHENGGVRHLADVKTLDGTIVEFRHSAINDEGKRTRAHFFGKWMLWVVDCVNRPKAVARFRDNKYTLLREHIPWCQVFSTEEPGGCFPRSWVKCNRFVIFDFGEEDVWCLFPRKRDMDRAIVMGIKKDDFVAAVKDGYEQFRERCADVWRKVKDAHSPRIDARHDSFAISTKPIGPPVTTVAQVTKVDSLKVEKTSAIAIRVDKARREAMIEPMKETWPKAFDRTVALAVTVDVITGWLVVNGRLSVLETVSNIKGEANAIGCCAIHCSTFCDQAELYWGKRRIKKEYGNEKLHDIPQNCELMGMAGCFVGIVEYLVEERPNQGVRIHLRNFRKLDNRFWYNQAKECIWRLDPDLRFRFAAIASQDILEGESRGGRPSDTIDTGRSE